jgi:uncharacterized protein (DUF1499 family)
MNIIFDLIAWETIFLGSSVGALGTGLLAAIFRRKRRPLGWLSLIFIIGALLPWLLVPRFGERLRQASRSNTVVTSERAEWPELRPRRLATSPAIVANALPEIVQQLGWRLVEQHNTTFQVEVSVLFGIFIDDMHIELGEDNGATVVSVRSQSRVGQGDLGENRRHVVQLWAALDQHFDQAE